MLLRLDRADEAAAAFDAAMSCDPPAADRRHLERRIAASR
jgi:RNA polymerase sigma-70 factor (ECF subfamily)